MTASSLPGLASYPVVKLKEAFESNTDDFYDQYLKNQKTRTDEEEALHCQREGLPLSQGMEEILQKVNLKNCTGCLPLAFPTCGDESCTCSKICPDWCQRVCPNNSSILVQSKQMSIPFVENNLDILNTKEEFGNVGIFGGYCNGITTLTKRMTALTKFKPNERPKDSKGKVITDQSKLREFYQEKIKNINDGKVTTIPGFSNIYDFSKQPDIQPLIKEAIRDAWSESNFYNPFLLESWGVMDEMSDQNFNEEFQEIKKMISMSGSTQVTLSLNENTGKGKGHTVEIYHTFEKKINNESILYACINDSNSYRYTYLSKYGWEKEGKPDSSPDGIYCPQPIVLKSTKNGTTTYQRSIKVDEMDKRDTIKHIKALREDCLKERKCDV